MMHTIQEFIDTWEFEAAATQMLLDLLTDVSLPQEAYPGGRTIGRLAWHIAQTIPEMMGKTGLHVSGLHEDDPAPASASAIAEAYRHASASLLREIHAHWTDATLSHTDNLYGEEWTRGRTLGVLIGHQTHHRGQLTVLMRQAGIRVTGVYGPAEEEWIAMGMEPPAV
jgi:uncharacterized damage-inducible protein DinB